MFHFGMCFCLRSVFHFKKCVSLEGVCFTLSCFFYFEECVSTKVCSRDECVSPKVETGNFPKLSDGRRCDDSLWK